MMNFRRPVCLVAWMVLPLAMLGACGNSEKNSGEAAPSGEVLEGTVSDAMLPLDTVRSQPPLAPRPDANGKGASGKPSDAKKEKDGEKEEGGPESAAAAAASPAEE